MNSFFHRIAEENRLFWELELYLQQLSPPKREAFIQLLMRELPPAQLVESRLGRKLQSLYLELSDTPIYSEQTHER